MPSIPKSASDSDALGRLFGEMIAAEAEEPFRSQDAEKAPDQTAQMISAMERHLFSLRLVKRRRAAEIAGTAGGADGINVARCLSRSETTYGTIDALLEETVVLESLDVARFYSSSFEQRLALAGLSGDFNALEYFVRIIIPDGEKHKWWNAELKGKRLEKALKGTIPPARTRSPVSCGDEEQLSCATSIKDVQKVAPDQTSSIRIVVQLTAQVVRDPNLLVYQQTLRQLNFCYDMFMPQREFTVPLFWEYMQRDVVAGPGRWRFEMPDPGELFPEGNGLELSFTQMIPPSDGESVRPALEDVDHSVPPSWSIAPHRAENFELARDHSHAALEMIGIDGLLEMLDMVSEGFFIKGPASGPGGSPIPDEYILPPDVEWLSKKILAAFVESGGADFLSAEERAQGWRPQVRWEPLYLTEEELEEQELLEEQRANNKGLHGRGGRGREGLDRDEEVDPRDGAPTNCSVVEDHGDVDSEEEFLLAVREKVERDKDVAERLQEMGQVASGPTALQVKSDLEEAMNKFRVLALLLRDVKVSGSVGWEGGAISERGFVAVRKAFSILRQIPARPEVGEEGLGEGHQHAPADWGGTMLDKIEADLKVLPSHIDYLQKQQTKIVFSVTMDGGFVDPGQKGRAQEKRSYLVADILKYVYKSIVREPGGQYSAQAKDLKQKFGGIWSPFAQSVRRAGRGAGSSSTTAAQHQDHPLVDLARCLDPGLIHTMFRATDLSTEFASPRIRIVEQHENSALRIVEQHLRSRYQCDKYCVGVISAK